MRITHVIYDLDGLLLDTERLYTEATRDIARRYGKTFDWSLKSRMMGRHELEAAQLLVETLELPITAEMAAVLGGRRSPAEAVDVLMGRKQRAEADR